jgi:hypothetical protein
MAEDRAHDFSENAHKLLPNRIRGGGTAFNNLRCPAAPVWIAALTLDLAIGLANATLGQGVELSRGEMTAE